MGRIEKRSATADVRIGGAIMARPKKDARYMNLYIATSIATQIDAFAAQTGLPKCRIAEAAFEEYLQRHVKTKGDSTEYVISVNTSEDEE